MPTIKSLEDLKKMREEALRKQELKATTGKTEIIVGMGTVGIAAGARETLKAILEFVDNEHLENIIRQTGNIGIDLRASSPGNPSWAGGNLRPVSTEIVKTIMEEHVVKGKIVEDYQVIVNPIPIDTLTLTGIIWRSRSTVLVSIGPACVEKALMS